MGGTIETGIKETEIIDEETTEGSDKERDNRELTLAILIQLMPSHPRILLYGPPPFS